MKRILTVGFMLIGTSAFSQEIPNVWKFKGMDTIRYSIPLFNKPFEEEFYKYNPKKPFIIVPPDSKNSQVYRMPVVVPPYVTVGLIPNPALDPLYQKSIMGR